MNLRFSILRAASLLVAVLLASCANQAKKPEPITGTPPKFVNPYPPGTYEHFTAEPNYPKTLSVWKNEELLDRTHAGNSHLRIDLATQRGFLMNGDQIVVDYPICSGRRGFETPKGVFPITEKIVDKRSNRYGRIYNSTGDCVNTDADITTDPVPEGGRFEGASMRYWMRLTGDGVGHHIGPVKRYPASHACIRGPGSVVPLVYSKVNTGTKVVIE